MKTWWEYQNARVSGVEKNVPWWVNDKLKLHKFLLTIISQPQIYMKSGNNQKKSS